MDADRERVERARLKNLEYIRKLDEQKADELLASVANESLDSPAANSSVKKTGALSSGGGSRGNSSVYITGLTTYMACRQLEGLCSKIGKVRRIKFYKDERGGLKGDAVVTFSSRITMTKAIDRLNHFEVKPGVIITAAEAVFSTKKTTDTGAETTTTQGQDSLSTGDSTVADESKEARDAYPAGQTVESPAAAVPSKATEIIPGDDGAAILDLPSRSIVLKHIWDPLESHDSSDATFFEDLEEDMRSECGKHGTVEHVQIVADGSVIVRFSDLNTAIACLKVMNGRWFAGQQIEAQFDQSKPENPNRWSGRKVWNQMLCKPMDSQAAFGGMEIT
ncbi:HIV Tat-specific factor 1 [Phytophthora boehmeriae]|uniref:HIV Tat-specific factor 1 n=1 Tax=Phytophthora boehmeriae TaxID=109152 RepID=A0A8T1VUY5_9STRA|nr:HIV Tat-specific factor 1 [Phytophthora boehmeriae]